MSPTCNLLAVNSEYICFAVDRTIKIMPKNNTAKAKPIKRQSSILDMGIDSFSLTSSMAFL